MNRLAVGTLLVAFLGGCGPADSSYPSAVPAYAGATPPNSSCADTTCCSQYTSCGTCTPIIGCGWCANSDGTGTCAATAAYCITDFIWEPNFCGGSVPPPAADASTGPAPADASADGTAADVVEPALDATPTDGPTPAADASNAEGGSDAEVVTAEAGMSSDAALDQSTTSATPPPIIADGGGCTANDGSFCGASQPYGVTCVQSSANSAVPEPPPSLECAVADTQTPAGTLYYCCSIMPTGDTPVTPIP